MGPRASGLCCERECEASRREGGLRGFLPLSSQSSKDTFLRIFAEGCDPLP